MRRAGFRYVFLGIENVLDDDLAFLRAAAKNAQREGGRPRRQRDACAPSSVLHRHGMFVVGGLIVGNPDDTRESIEANLAFARSYVDWPYIQHPTPYPGTPMTQRLPRARTDRRPIGVEEYDGTTAVVRSEHLDGRRDRVHALAGRALDEGAAPADGASGTIPASCCATAGRCCAHTFRGSTLALGARPRDASATCSRATRRSAGRAGVPRPPVSTAGSAPALGSKPKGSVRRAGTIVFSETYRERSEDRSYPKTMKSVPREHHMTRASLPVLAWAPVAMSLEAGAEEPEPRDTIATISSAGILRQGLAQGEVRVGSRRRARPIPARSTRIGCTSRAVQLVGAGEPA